MEPIVSKSLPVSLNQHRSHGPIFLTVWYRWKKETLGLKKVSEYWLQGV